MGRAEIASVGAISSRQSGKRKERAVMKIVVTSVYVDDQEKALHFYTEKLGLDRKSVV